MQRQQSIPAFLRYLEKDSLTAAISVVACLGAAIVIQARFVDLASPHLALYLGIICILGAAAAASLWLALPAPRPLASREGSRPPVRIVMVAAGVVGLGCALLSARLVATDGWDAQWWWLLGMGVPLAAFSLSRLLKGRQAPPEWPDVDAREAVGLAILFALALTLRVVDVTTSPPLLHGDEASCGLYGRIFNAGHTPLLSISWFGLPMLSYAVSGVGLRLFGDDLSGLRTINALIGALSLVLLYLLGKEWFGRRAAALAAILGCFAFLHLELSRDGIHYIQGPTCITLSLYLCTLAVKRGGVLTAYLAGLSFVLDLQVYWSARVGPLLAAGLLLFLLLWERRLVFARRLELPWIAVGTLIAGLPVAALFHDNPGSFSGHQGAVSIFSSDPNTQGHLISQYGHISTLELVHQQAWRLLTTFNAHPDSSSLFEWWPHPMLDTVMAALLPAALILALFRWRRWEYAVCLAWFWSIVVAGIVTIDPPIWPRMFALLPAVLLLIGVLLAEVWRQLEYAVEPKRWAPLVLVPVLALMARDNLYAAFVDYPEVTRQISMGPTYVGNFLAHAPGADHTVMLSDGGYFLSYEPIQFLAPHAAGCTLLPQQPPSSCPDWSRSKLFILLPGRVKDLAGLQQQRPGGRVVSIATYSYGTAHILAYELP